MLDNKTANLIMRTVNSGNNEISFGNLITLPEARHMEKIKSSEDGSYSIFALQKGDLSILVRVYSVSDFGSWETKVAKVQFVQW